MELLIGFEPTTRYLQDICSTVGATEANKKQDTFNYVALPIELHPDTKLMVGVIGLEPIYDGVGCIL